MQNNSSRLRNTRRNPIQSTLLEALEARTLLSSTHPDFLPLAQPKTPAPNTAPSKLDLAHSGGFFLGQFKDREKTDTHFISIDWGDGQTTPLSLNAGITKFKIPEHSYTVRGAYTATVTVTDSANASTSNTINLYFADYDLIPSLKTAPNIDTSIITGQPTTASISVTLTNYGFSISPAGTISISLRPTAGSDINITTAPTDLPIVKASVTKNGKTTHSPKSVNVDVTVPTTLAPGTYSIVITVSDGETSTAGNNNTLVIPNFTITAAPGAANIAATLTLPKFPTTVVTGTAASGNVTLTFTNTGNIPSIDGGEYDVSLLIHPASGPDIPFFSKSNVILPPLKPGSGKFTVTNTSLILSSSITSALPIGTYTIIAILTPHAGTPSGTLTVTGPSITVTAGSNTGSSLLKHGDVLQCDANTQLTGTDFLEIGNFSTNTHTNGSYRFTNFGITITYANNETDSLGLVAFTGAQTFLDPVLDGNPTKITFSTDPTGAFASFLLNATTTTIYAKMG